MNLTQALLDRGHRVTLWSSDFYHQEKRHRFGRDAVIDISDRLQVRLITTIGYRRNVGIRRFADHAQLASRFPGLARKAPCPDVAFVGFPPVELAAVAVRFLQHLNVPTLLDIKDLWPDLFEDPLPAVARPVARALLSPLHSLTTRAIRDCAGVCAPSEGFLSWARGKAGVAPRSLDTVAPLTSPHAPLDYSSLDRGRKFWDDMGVPNDGRPRAAFVGTLGRSFDLDCVFRAALSERGRVWQWVVCGTGEWLDKYRRFANGHPHIIMPGWIDRSPLLALLQRSTAGLAPYRSIPNFELNICNKVYDYLAAGVPVVSPLRGDVRELLVNEGVGICYKQGDSDSLLDALDGLLLPERRRVMGAAGARLFSDRFEAARAYARLVSHLESMVEATTHLRSA